jgi:nitrate reductase NapA
MTGRIANLAQASGLATVELNDQDAFARELKTGDSIEVTSRFGSIQATAKVSSSPRRGVLFAAFWDVRLLINEVVADHLDPTSKQPEYKVTAVNVRKVRT